MPYLYKSFDVVAYTYGARNLCPGCTIAALPTGDGERFDGWAVAEGAHMAPEDNLRELAFAFGIDYGDASTYDSDDFPKPVVVDQLADDETCGQCGGVIL